MPEYLAPGVYVEEVSFRPRSIEGVSTSTTAFAGPTRRGPLNVTPELVTSFGEFSRVFGGLGDLSFGAGQSTTNYMAHAVRGFFNNGGSRLFIARTFTPAGASDAGIAQSDAFVTSGPAQARFVAMAPGSGYNGRVRAIEKQVRATAVTLRAAPSGSLMSMDAPPEGGGGGPTERVFFIKRGNDWVSATATGESPPVLNLDTGLGANPMLHLVTVEATDADDNVVLYEDLGVGPDHPRAVTAVLSANPARRSDAVGNPFFLQVQGTVTPIALRNGLFSAGPEKLLEVRGGNDGAQPESAVADDETEPNATGYEEALLRLEEIEDISIVAAPGYSAYGDADAVQGMLITHVDVNTKYRIAVLDSKPDDNVTTVQQTRARVDSTRAALYFPWVVVDNPLATPDNELIPKEITLPPSGFVCGVYARSDANTGVWKAPANEVVMGALRFALEVNQRQQELLNPLGINCLRYFFGRGNRVWGARTVSSDPNWKYVNVRRYFNYLERSIDRSTQWAVFEPNGERLWASIRGAVADFLFNEWRNGALLGSKPDEAFFVRCDRSTMTQNDLDNGRLICEIGVAVLKPAEFVIFRIGQKTADARQ
jgi:phage tail sheath protein FI